jgi:PhoH-like ATPase
MTAVRSMDGTRATNGPRTRVHETHVLFYDPNALYGFAGHRGVIPITLIAEIDKFKKDLNDTVRNARTVSRSLDKMGHEDRLAKCVKLSSGGQLRVVHPPSDVGLSAGLFEGSNDTLILDIVHQWSEKAKPSDAVVVTRDTNMRIEADSLGMQTEHYVHAHPQVGKHYTGTTQQPVNAAPLSQLAELAATLL